ncbi:helix-turn-helix transcriptional regulator [Desulfovibrio sp. ZJ369]|uniref:helix-turn-helix domain-containing protein n=1 Tax=Desulfovibrio sp. ZJ369 TaxID=2709793 RepID=UPI0013EE25D9|nr:helix-turn-helix transcriptional regulator [Desulfovibrio sp. ZJ369]
METVGSRIKALRRPKNQDWLAEKLGIPKGTLSNYESGKSELNFAILRAITAFFNVSSDWLLFGLGPQYRSGTGAQTSSRNFGDCSGCAALERVLEYERRERHELSEKNRELSEQIGQLKERLKALGGGGEAEAARSAEVKTA